MKTSKTRLASELVDWAQRSHVAICSLDKMKMPGYGLKMWMIRASEKDLETLKNLRAENFQGWVK